MKQKLEHIAKLCAEVAGALHLTLQGSGIKKSQLEVLSRKLTVAASELQKLANFK